jgi:transposase InsO family protein
MPWEKQSIMNQRVEFALRALQTENFRALCREYGISAKVGYKWRERFLREGLGGMREKSRRPHGNGQGLCEEVVCRMIRLKERHRHWGPRKIREIYLRQWGEGPSESSFKRVLEKSGLTQKRRAKRAAETGRISSGKRASEANEVWTVDFKGWWYDAQGKCEPLTVRDEYSRYVLELRAMRDAKTRSVQECFERLFERHGLPGAIRSDNGSPFASAQGLLGLSKLSAWWLANGIDLERSRPGCPQDNGGHERMHRDIALELEGVEQEERQAAFDTWRNEYNQERSHEALCMRVPAELYEPSRRKWEGTPERIDYPAMATRRVNQIGKISYEGRMLFVSTALAGWEVGLQALKEGRVSVYFSRLLLGEIEPESHSFMAASPVPSAQETPE